MPGCSSALPRGLKMNPAASFSSQPLSTHGFSPPKLPSFTDWVVAHYEVFIKHLYKNKSRAAVFRRSSLISGSERFGVNCSEAAAITGRLRRFRARHLLWELSAQ